MLFLDYYQPVFWELYQELADSNYSIDVPSPKTASFWRVVPPGEYEGLSAHQVLDSYIESVEGELASLMAKQSLAYWLHAFRRLLPAPAG